MTGKALSEHVKAQKQQRHDNWRMQSVIDEYLIEKSCPLKPGETRQGYQPIDTKSEFLKSTLERLVNGGQTISAFNTLKRKLDYAAEHVLVDFILESAD
jgi:hypothetical protein